MTAQRIRSGSDASGIPVPLSKVLPQRLAESVHQIRFIANRARNTKDLTFPDPAEHPDTLYQLYPDGVEAFGREHAHARQLVRHLVGPVRQGVQVEPAQSSTSLSCRKAEGLPVAVQNGLANQSRPSTSSSPLHRLAPVSYIGAGRTARVSMFRIRPKLL